MWQWCLCGDDAVPCRGLDRGVIGLFGSGASSYRPPRSHVALPYPESRGTPKWANMRIFHGSIIQSKSQGSVFLEWAVIHCNFDTSSVCSAVFSLLIDVGDTHFLLFFSHALVVWMPWCTITSIISTTAERLFPLLLFFHRQLSVLFEYVGRDKSIPLSDKSTLMKGYYFRCY